MSKTKTSRKERRRLEKLTQSLKVNFSKLSESFASDHINSSVDGMTEQDSQDLLDHYDERWRSYARYILSKYPEVSKVEKKRLSILNRFRNFANKFLERVEEREKTNSQTEQLETKDVGIETMRQALKKVGVITQAKTVPGVQKRVNELPDDKRSELIKVLNSSEL